MTNTVIFFGGILLALVIGSKLKINIGLVAAALAFPVGILAGGLSANGVVALFPTTLFLNFLIATFLFGFAGCNGTLKTLAAHLLYRCRNTGWVIGLLFFVVTVIIAAMGAGGSAPFFMSAICFNIAIQAGIRPLLVPLAVWTGSMVGGGVPWTSGYATSIGQLEIYFSPEASTAYASGYYIWRAVFYTLLYLVMFVLLKGYKVKRGSVVIDKPEPFNEEQKKSLAIILVVIACILIPSALGIICPNTFTKQLSKILSFQFVATVGIIANVLLKTAPYQTVVRERIPWDSILMLTLTGVYMGLAKPLGMVEFMGEYLQNSVSASLIVPGIVLLMCVMSFFVSGGVVIPMMLPLIPVLSEAAGLSPAVLYCATQIGLTASSISPFSQGGASALTGCPDDDLRQKLIKEQTIASGIISVVAVIIAIVGGFNVLQ